MSELKGWARLLQNIRGSGVAGLHTTWVRMKINDVTGYCALGAAMPDEVINLAAAETIDSDAVSCVTWGDDFNCRAYRDYFTSIGVTPDQVNTLIDFNDRPGDITPQERLARVIKFLEQKVQEERQDNE